jgi:hypothetical protein
MRIGRRLLIENKAIFFKGSLLFFPPFFPLPSSSLPLPACPLFSWLRLKNSTQILLGKIMGALIS